MTGRALGGIAVCLLVAGALVLLLLKSGVFGPDSSGRQIAAGLVLYEKNCASCHGRNLEGQPNWQTLLPSGKLPAPPHDRTGHSWHHSDSILAGITKRGVVPYVTPDYQSDMPAFEGKLSDEEIRNVWDYIKSTWPERERNYQTRITQQSEQLVTP